MAMKLKSSPSNLTFYTTWWLTSTSSISPKITSSSQTSLKLDDKCNIIEQVINQDEFVSNCCIPIKIFRIKR
ncbi:unnamed protein product [Adineta steineri]|uniref:Uncharacterized protein n=1 Tax=Adineta steineri TaxID=433720 RepID=A0A814RCW5_9BILA|nr:unnamed protein product [Adineta steineri]CAF1082053.1 unnamed protein product [Adineta steineri]CAF1099630.1 unnamed protein product [Adineta steineri]CAF1131488.1 unnamed protein product [Adineta steineri]CAF1209695.1 unnamed protein product [Adineta steineri]